MVKNGQVTRRTVLRGLGTAVALPFLESLAPLGACAAEDRVRPLRMAFFFVPNGMNMEKWRVAGGEGPLAALSPTLTPLEKVKSSLLVLTGLSHHKARANGDGAGDHARSNATFLTGRQIRKTNGADIRAGVSVDQLAAQKVGDRTRFPSLEFGIERGRDAGNCDSGYSCAYSSNISWRGEATPMAKEVSPRAAFERLFGDPRQLDAERDRARRDLYRKSVLDLVQEDAEALQKQLGTADRGKVDEYLESVRALEKQIQAAEKEATRRDLPKLDLPEGTPKDAQQHIRLMMDILAIAFQADVTRIASFTLANDGSNRTFPSIGVREGHHTLSHHGKNPEKLDKIAKIDRFYVEQFAYFLEKMAAIREGAGTMLDNSMFLYGCAIGDGNRHNHNDLPILLAGKGGGTIKSGRHAVHADATPMCNLFLSMLDRVGVKEESFGDGTGRLPL